jgi:hypothetical protein
VTPARPIGYYFRRKRITVFPEIGEYSSPISGFGILVERGKRGDIDASQQMWIKEAREVIIGERDLIAPR